MFISDRLAYPLVLIIFISLLFAFIFAHYLFNLFGKFHKVNCYFYRITLTYGDLMCL